ncbi:MAG TPA: 4-hydroxy-2-oxovalerate aldolase, partial [Solirubrobacteraceae bacterium]
MSVRVTDTTLRDGSHPMRHRYTAAQVEAIVRALDAGGVPVIEVSHGDGLGGSSLQYGMSSTAELELIEHARRTASRARIAVLL